MVVPVTAELIVAGFQVPVIPLVDIDASNGAVEFWQSGPICVKIGVTTGLTTTVKVVVVAHCPAVGVNV